MPYIGGGNQMKEDFVSPLYDSVFTYVFGNQHNIANTRNFLKALLDIPEKDFDRLTIKNTVLKPAFLGGKTGIVDLVLTTKSDRVIHIEMQVEKANNLRSRILYYAARLLSEQLKKQQDYNSLHQVISILICDHKLLDEERTYYNEYVLRNKENRCFTDLLKVIILELPKVPDEEDSRVWPWLQFLKSKSEEDYRMLVKKHPEMEQAANCVQKFLLSDRIRTTILLRDMRRTAIRDREEYLKDEVRKREEEVRKKDEEVRKKDEELVEARNKLEETREEANEELNKIASKLKATGMSPEQIKAITGLQPEDIEN